MSSDPQIVRQWLLLHKLAQNRFGVGVRELADELGVTEKTIRRDLSLLQSVGFPLDEEVGQHGRKAWRLAAANGRPPLTFAFDELLALYLGRRLLDPLSGTFVGQATQKAFRKIRAAVGPKAREYLEKMADRLHLTSVGAADYSAKAEILDHLQRGVEESKAALIEYQSQRSTEPVTYEIFPYALAHHRGSLYVVAFSREHNEVRQFKLDRVERAELTEFPFHRPDDFDVARYFGGSFGVYHGDGDVLVRVRFLPGVARYVQEAKWHASQKLTRQKDGSLIAEFHLSTTEEIKHWLLSFGRQAVVLAPESLATEIVAELRDLLAAYENRPSPSGRG